MYSRRSTTVKYVLAAFFGAIVYCEWFIYLLQQSQWAEFDCSSDQDTSCVKILFIADPQIQGDEAVPPPLSYIFNWDSDRYLKSTFNVVADYFKPDILVYLGDLMDEGSISTLPQYHSYVKRLSKIFDWDHRAVMLYQVGNSRKLVILTSPAASSITSACRQQLLDIGNLYFVPHFMQVWIPGDNDIGGENEPIRHDKIEEFEKVFQQPSVITYSNVSIYKVNAITYTFPQKTEEPKGTENNFKIAVSHYPVTLRLMFTKKIMDTINPQIFFCAHDHESKYIKQYKDFTHKLTTWFNTPKSTLSITFDDYSLFEIYVPTCSYRMGTSKIGYGAAILENNQKNMRYTVFWSPTRFPYLCLYLGILIASLVYSLVFCVARVCHRCSKHSVKSADRSPLLEIM